MKTNVIKRNNPEKIKFVFYFLIFLIFLIVVAVFINYRFFSEKGALFSSLHPKATLSLDQVDHTASKGGLKQWSLKAATVNYFQDRNEALFQTLTLVMYSREDPPTTLTSDKGRMDTQTNDISAFGHVVVVNGLYTLETETLHFKDKERIITVPVTVKITKAASHITSDRMTIDMNTNIAIMEGHVKGVFSGPF
ncbi:MAG: LPS export ABC transporter periplasmic protein LptC [Proteobacteria bacterium]|nr:LPS export ABC transporter periplasmic protein LptC [Pseudomonadota bacterium]